MAHLIDKSALVAEIERRIKNLYPKGGQGMVVTKILKDHYEDLLSFIDTLEVKEVDLGREIRRYRMNNPIIGHREESLYNYMSNVAMHFFELGMAVSNKTQKRGNV